MQCCNAYEDGRHLVNLPCVLVQVSNTVQANYTGNFYLESGIHVINGSTLSIDGSDSETEPCKTLYIVRYYVATALRQYGKLYVSLLATQLTTLSYQQQAFRTNDLLVDRGAHFELLSYHSTGTSLIETATGTALYCRDQGRYRNAMEVSEQLCS